MTIRSMKTAGMALNVGLCNNIGKCKDKKSQLRGLGLWRRPALKSQKYGKPSYIGFDLSSHNLPTDSARELFKPSKEAKHLLGSVLKNRALSCLNIFWCDDTTGEVWKFLDDVIGSEKRIKLQFKCFPLKYTK